MSIVGLVFVIGCVCIVLVYLLLLARESRSTRRIKPQEEVEDHGPGTVYPSNHVR